MFPKTLTQVRDDGRHCPKPLCGRLSNLLLCSILPFCHQGLGRLQNDEDGIGLVQCLQGRFCHQVRFPLMSAYHDPR